MKDNRPAVPDAQSRNLADKPTHNVAEKVMIVRIQRGAVRHEAFGERRFADFNQMPVGRKILFCNHMEGEVAPAEA